MEQQELLETTTEQVKDAINILQLLSVEITTNEDDVHIQRSIGIIEKILQSAEKNLRQLNTTD